MDTYTAFSTAITNTGEIYQCIPSVTQGINDHQRIGSQVQPVSLTTKVNICVTSRQEPSISIYAHIFFLTSKNIKDWKKTAAVPITDLLDRGDGTNADFNGSSYNAMFPINKSEFNVIAHKKILLQKGRDNPNVAYSPAETSSTDTFKYFSSFSQKIPVPKEYQYLVAADTRPTNHFPFMVMGFTATDQHGETILSALQLRVQAQSHLYFKDA